MSFGGCLTGALWRLMASLPHEWAFLILLNGLLLAIDTADLGRGGGGSLGCGGLADTLHVTCQSPEVPVKAGHFLVTGLASLPLDGPRIQRRVLCAATMRLVTD